MDFCKGSVEWEQCYKCLKRKESVNIKSSLSVLSKLKSTLLLTFWISLRVYKAPLLTQRSQITGGVAPQ